MEQKDESKLKRIVRGDAGGNWLLAVTVINVAAVVIGMSLTAYRALTEDRNDLIGELRKEHLEKIEQSRTRSSEGFSAIRGEIQEIRSSLAELRLSEQTKISQVMLSVESIRGDLRRINDRLNQQSQTDERIRDVLIILSDKLSGVEPASNSSIDVLEQQLRSEEAMR